MKNWYPITISSKQPDWVREARIFIQLNLQNTYWLSHIKQCDTIKTAFLNPNGYVQYPVTLHRLSQALATFLIHIDDYLGHILIT